MPKTQESASFSFFPSAPPPIHLYIELQSDLLAVPPKHILSLSTSFHPCPSHFTFLQCPSSPKLRRKTQTPCMRPNAHLSALIFWHSPPQSLFCFSLHASLKPPSVPSSRPLHLSFLLLGITHHMAGFYYSGLGSNVTSLDKWSLIIQPTLQTALLHNPTLLFSVTHLILQLSPITFLSLFLCRLSVSRK